MSMILSRRDLNFVLYEWLKVDELTRIPRYADHSRETFDAALDTCEKIATDLFAPHNKKNDQQEPHFDGETVSIIPEVSTALKAFCEAGLMAAGQDYELGGMQLPVVVEKAGFAYFKGANVGTSSYPFLTIGNANLLLTHGTPAQVETFVKPEMDGRFFGTMCLSEPQAGSSLSDITTRAEYEGESPLGAQYRLRGNKMWISAGEHELSENIVHLVLAKIPGPDGKLIPGVKGISLFIVPKYLVNEDGSLGEHNDVVLAGLNHKMGYRGTTNCLLNFGEGMKYRPGGKAGAIGYLVGEPHKGLACMFHMMNEARIGVGLGAVMLGYTGYLHALDYARNRPQGRAVGPGGKDAASPQVKLVEHADIRRMLLAQKSYVEGGLALNLYCARLVDEEEAAAAAGDQAAHARLALLLDILTPIAKSWPSQWCLEANNLAIQVHGGYGYTREYNVEQFYRDNRLNPIHEGTHGIQGLDLLGRKVVMKDGAAFKLLGERVQDTITRALAAGNAELSQQAGALGTATKRLAEVTQALWSAGDPNVTLANASVYLEAFGHVVVAWIWLEQALLAQAALPRANGKEDEDFYRGKLAAAAYFFRWELPKVGPQLALLESLDRTTLDMQDAWF
ncbi:Acyl-CoA dehydrogenase related to the alkylation response protein AidB [Cupriavidus necator]|uniref:Acyl-CoA dehydrogenase n=1 Tax=Cupriavidus necator (strain ATCC 17699 / DSM 428 / KCTC 22496 / NCIMB 10442 / H16 / Stanier 337) TaxID=381666 RepID=Q0KBF9_CUPNH|nr:acyl-CoA dehydrogenase [Cupriavidus necator]KUE88716.1 acyl-CoA dehydrogenase [Cupriavidus necator]QCC00539.1 acyl-CoA dehydrogenase [Cupriavidus necator H16]QQB76642.1 acyl-CoA dehydrogenase [Cupriavidus necator]WKA42403.1 acyl-CoA dehydrogenase [Cupriavidus necator]CAJ92662.1 Acyl-CoA dehydrogenase [Cupriavidus necator H16]